MSRHFPEHSSTAAELSALAARRETALGALQAALQTPAKPWAVNYTPAAAWEASLSQLWAAFVADLSRDERSAQFSLALEGVLRQARESGEPLENWQRVMTVLAQQVLPQLGEPGLLRAASSLLQHGQMLTGEAQLRWQAHRQALLEHLIPAFPL